MPNAKTARSTVRALSLAAALLLAGCATPPPADDAEGLAEYEQTNDPLEPANRAIFSFNQAVDKAVLKPVAKGYRYVVPQFGRDRVHDVLVNLSEPLSFIHSLLQGELRQAGITLGRFGLNSTFGVLGIMDVAGPMGLTQRSEDGGQTMAVWGVGEGPYLVLPLLGPSNPRDFAGWVGDWFVDPYTYATRDAKWARYARTGANVVDTRERYIDVLDDLERNSLDFYAAMRSTYRQRRAEEIRNSKPANGK